MQFYISSNVYIEYINYSIKNICIKMISHITLFAFVFIRFHQKNNNQKRLIVIYIKKNRFTIPTLERNFFFFSPIYSIIFSYLILTPQAKQTNPRFVE
jgi:hypothetical protein